MTCFTPLTAARVAGQSQLVFNYTLRKDVVELLKVPCGQCVGCRLERSRQWAVRCVHEAQLHSKNCYITLTYAPEHLPADGSLQLVHYQQFMKRLRHHFPQKLRFFHCGEYGEKTFRPHYHAILFNCDFDDKKCWMVRNGYRYYISDLLSRVWGHGHAVLGACTFESAAYVARYVMKKVTGAPAVYHYTRWDQETGEVLASLKPEYVTMSRRPGIAAEWIKKYCADVYPHDHVVVRGRACRPPRFYDDYLKQVDAPALDEVKYLRFLEAQKHLDDQTEERLNTKRLVKEASLRRLPRPLD